MCQALPKPCQSCDGFSQVTHKTIIQVFVVLNCVVSEQPISCTAALSSINLQQRQEQWQEQACNTGNTRRHTRAHTHTPARLQSGHGIELVCTAKRVERNSFIHITSLTISAPMHFLFPVLDGFVKRFVAV